MSKSMNNFSLAIGLNIKALLSALIFHMILKTNEAWKCWDPLSDIKASLFYCKLM